MATSSIALFGVLSAKAKGEPLPENVAYDRHGQWTTNAADVLDDGGSIATFGGHKGLGLALTVELLAGALSGSAVLGEVESKTKAQSWGHVVVAICPELLTDDFPRKAASVIAAVKASGPAVRIPGERSAQMAAERRQAGVMPIPERIWESIVYTAQHGLKER